MRLRRFQKGERSRWKLLIWTAVASLVFGLIGLGEVAEDALRAMRNSTHFHKASGDIVLVAIDDRSLRDVGQWPWARRHHAALTTSLTQAGANRIFFDVNFAGRSTAADDASLADAIKQARTVVLPVSARFGTPDNDTPIHMLPETTGKNVELGVISVWYNYQNAVWRLNYSRTVDG